MRCRPTGWWAVVTGELFPAVRPGGLNASITCSSRTSTVVTQTMERNRRCQSPLRSHFGKCPNEVTVSHVRQCKRLCTATQRRSLSDWERFHQIARRRLGARNEGGRHPLPGERTEAEWRRRRRAFRAISVRIQRSVDRTRSGDDVDPGRRADQISASG
jgi:hypothetical protein